MDIFRIFDSLNYLPNMKVAMEAVRETHAICEGPSATPATSSIRRGRSTR
jgi:pyruvate carboxylase